MTEIQIENILRKAPRPAAPPGLKAKLAADIALPRAAVAQRAERTAGIPLWRRWFPALAFGMVFLTCCLLLAVQTSQFLGLRRENQSLRVATVNLEQLRQENAELQQLRAASQDAERLRKDNEELLRLRAEVAQLRAQAQELATLRAENQRLRAERTAAAAKAGVVAEEDPFAVAQEKANRIHCVNNMKQIGLAARIWANDHNGVLPADFLTMSNELASPKILICTSDTARKMATTWQEFDGGSVSYEILSPGASVRDLNVVYVRCPIHNNVGQVDGSVAQLDSNHRVEQVDGKFKIVRSTPPAQP